MKKVIGVILVVAVAIYAIVDTIHDFIAYDIIHYYSAQPGRLLPVAAITVVGGLIAFCFYLLSPRLQRRAKLFALSSAASFMMLAGAYFAFQIFHLPADLVPRYLILIVSLLTAAIAGMIWLEFYRVLRSGDRVA